VPAALTAIFFDEHGTAPSTQPGDSQPAASFAVFPLVMFTSDREVGGSSTHG
jgi:hypothetical protein